MKEMPDIFARLNSLIYVDDVLYEADSLEQAFKLSSEEAGMNLRQFSTNSTELRKLRDDSRIIKSDVEQRCELFKSIRT